MQGERLGPVSGSNTAGLQKKAGWQALARGSWAEAAGAFDEALSVDGDDPDALEGRSWAAWWLGEAEVLFTTRERAFHRYRERGDPVSAARAAIWVGCDHHDFRGEHAVANGWYQRARRLLEDAPRGAEHAWLAFQQGAYAIELAEDTVEAKARARETIDIARSLDLTDLVFLGLALEGLALVTEGSVEEGMRALDEASLAAISGEFIERVPRTWTLCYMIYACERVRDFDRTAQWCNKMQQIASQAGSDFASGVCRAHYGGVLVFHGDWNRAEDELREAGAQLAGARPPAVAESDARLGELRRRQGRVDEADELFRRALPHPLAVLGLAHVALDGGDPYRAIELAEDLAASTPASSVTQLVDTLYVLAVARGRLGEIERAAEAVSALDEIASRVGNRPLAAVAAAAGGAVALADGDPGRARRCYERALAAFQQGRLPYEAALARGELAVALAQLGRTDEATAQAAASTRQLVAMGAATSASPLDRADGAALSSSSNAPRVAGLTRREVEVLSALTDGLTDREIAQRLTISVHTAHRHVSNIFTKLGVTTRAAAAAQGARHGLGS